MRRVLFTWMGVLILGFSVLAASGCGDDVRRTETITIYEEEPVKMVSPGEPIVE